MSARTFLAAVTALTLAVAVGESLAIAETASIATPESGAAAAANGLTTVDNSTGTLRASYPFQLQTARGDVQPSLSLTYDSSSGIREAGFSWGFDVPNIERRHPSGARGAPTDTDPPALNADHFYYGGQPLVPLCGVGIAACRFLTVERLPDWAIDSGWTYFRPEVESEFARFFWSGDHMTWVMQRKSGEVLEFGAPLATSGNHSDHSAIDFDDKQFPLRWNLVRRSDVLGATNRIVYVWGQPDAVGDSKGRSYLLDIFDTPDFKQNYAHRTHLSWLPRLSRHLDFSPRWHAPPQYKLSNVLITSASLGSTDRSLVRRYVLGYEDNDTETMLLTVQMEGRCGGALIPEQTAFLGQAITHCPTLPTTTYSYGPALVPTVSPITGPAPDPSDGPTLIDMTNDGLPDWVAASKTLSGQGKVYANKLLSTGTQLTATTMDIAPSVLGAVSSTFLSSSYGDRLAFGNLFGDGRLNALWHDQAFTSFALYSPFTWNAGYIWYLQALPASLPGDIASKPASIPAWGNFFPTSDQVVTTFGDIDGDGVTDALCTRGSNYLSQRSPDGTIQPFANHILHPAQVLPNTTPGPVCDWSPSAPTNNTSDHPGDWIRWEINEYGGHQASVDLPSVATVQLIDMNADGISDSVQLEEFYEYRCMTHNLSANVQLAICDGNKVLQCTQWIYRGRGARITVSLGNGDSTFQPPYVPFNSSKEGAGFQFLEDVNADGLADLVMTNDTGVIVRLGEWQPSYANGLVTMFGPADASFTAPTAFWDRQKCLTSAGDMDGSGTNDIVVLCPGGSNSGAYKSYDNGRPVRKLQSIKSGRGLTTLIEYTSTSSFLSSTPGTLAKTTPQPMHVVTKVTTENSLPGTAQEIHSAAYQYSNPVYDGVLQTFRGFQDVYTHSIGGLAPVVHTHYLLGDCQDDAGHLCPRIIDRPYAALRGLPVLTEVGASNTGYLSTKHSTYRSHVLYNGYDGRKVRVVYPEQEDTFLYDTSPFTASLSTITLPEIDDVDDSLSTSFSVPLQAVAKHLQTKQMLDDFGNLIDAWDYGDIAADSPIHTQHGWDIQGVGNWSWRQITTAISDGGGAALGHRYIQMYYDALARTDHVVAFLDGTLPLDRHHENPAKAIAPPPATASTGGWITLAKLTYDVWGNVIRAAGANGRCIDITYDPLFGQLKASNTTYMGTGVVVQPLLIGTCGGTALTTIMWVDRGFEKPFMTTGLNGDIAQSTYDPFGRLLTVARPSGTPHITTQIAYVDVQDAAVQLMHTQTSVGNGVFRNAWTYIDGFGNTVLSLTEADQSAGDGGGWLVGGLPARDSFGRVIRSFLPGFYSGAGNAYPLTTWPSTSSRVTAYDAFGRAIRTNDIDGTVLSTARYHALSSETANEKQISLGLHTDIINDGHGRTTQTVDWRAQKEAVAANMVYYATGELQSVTQSHIGGSEPPVTRWMQYDSFGRMVLNAEPNTGTWRYAYNDAGDLVGTSDARGCGENLYYDAGGRPVAEDYSPCLIIQADYTTPKFASTILLAGSPADGSEVFNIYDAPEAGQSEIGFQLGRLAAIMDRASHTQFAYDLRGNTIGVQRQLARADGPDPMVENRYAPFWYQKFMTYDDADRVVSETTGADVAELTANGSSLSTTYSARGVVSQVMSSYSPVPLLIRQSQDADGFLRSQTFGDAANTVATYTPDARRRLSTSKIARSSAGPWGASGSGYVPPIASDYELQKTLASETYGYVHGDLTSISDQRTPTEWPSGAKPVSRAMTYDAIGQLKTIDYTYATGMAGVTTDSFVSPLLAEVNDSKVIPFHSTPTTNRVGHQEYDYDWLGNITRSDDDAHIYWDRSIGQSFYNGPALWPNQMMSSGAGMGLNVPGGTAMSYDASGNLKELIVVRTGVVAGTAPCNPGDCFGFHYEWDEVGNMSAAHRWELPQAWIPVINTPAPNTSATFAYDGSHSRVLRISSGGDGRIYANAEIFPTLRLDHASWSSNTGDYVRTATSESVYLGGFGRVLYSGDVPSPYGNKIHVLLEVGNHLASTSIVIDQATSELVERSTYQAYGMADSDYRPTRWDSFRESYRFTGKEDDTQLGIVYFGARYYVPALSRWASPDPLTIHGLGGDTNPYAYVHGSPLSLTDSNGLDVSVTHTVDAGGEQTGIQLCGEGDDCHTTVYGPGTKIAIPGGGYYQRGSGSYADSRQPTASDAQPGEDDSQVAEKDDPLRSKLRQKIKDWWDARTANDEDKGKHDPIQECIFGCSIEQHKKDQAEQQPTAVEVAVSAAWGFAPFAAGGIISSVSKNIAKRMHLGRIGMRGTAYSVAFEMQLKPDEFGLSRPEHFELGRQAIIKEMEKNAALNELLKGNPGLYRRSPPGWTWHHATSYQFDKRKGVMQLVPTIQHASGWYKLWLVFHPGGIGGYSQWAIPAGAPDN